MITVTMTRPHALECCISALALLARFLVNLHETSNETRDVPRTVLGAKDECADDTTKTSKTSECCGTKRSAPLTSNVGALWVVS